MRGLVVSFTDCTYLSACQALAYLEHDLWNVRQEVTSHVELVCDTEGFVNTELLPVNYVYVRDWREYNRLVKDPPSWIADPLRRAFVLVPAICPDPLAEVVHFERPTPEVLLGIAGSVDLSWDLNPIHMPIRDVVLEVSQTMSGEKKSFISIIHPRFYSVPQESRQATRDAVNRFMLGGQMPRGLPEKLSVVLRSEECLRLREQLEYAVTHGIQEAHLKFPDAHMHDLTYFHSRISS